MSEVDKNLSSILEIEVTLTEEPEKEVIVGELMPSENAPPATTANTAVVEPVAVLPDRDVDYDYAFSRITHRDLIEKGMPALDDLLKVAKESQHPRAYEVAANMMKSLSDMTDKLMVLQKQRKELKAGKEETPASVRVDKAVFVGSTAELLKQIKQNE